MPSEKRKVIFAQDEVIKAVVAYDQHGGLKVLPPGEIVKVALGGNSEPNLVLSILDPSSGNCKTATLEATYLAAAMLKFCFDHKIPIPRRASKSVEIVDGGLALSLSVASNKAGSKV